MCVRTALTAPMCALTALRALTAITAVLCCFHGTVGINPAVNCTETSNDGNANLMCRISSSMDVVQVTWQKRKGNSYETLVTNSKKFGIKISNSYENRLSVLETADPGTSVITLSQLEKEDDACFTAIFNVYPNGALRGEICLQKPRGVREVVCKSPADINVTLDPPQIKTRHTEPNGTTIQIGRWLDNSISPMCSFQLRKMRRKTRNVQDGEVFTIECNTSGTQRPTITWSNEGQPISREEKVNITGDLITVTSTRRLLMSSLSEHEGISCSISFNTDLMSCTREDYNPWLPQHDAHQADKEVKSVEEEEDVLHDKTPNFRSIVPFVAGFLTAVSLAGVCFFLAINKEPESPKKDCRAEKGSLTPLNRKDLNTSNNTGTPGTDIKQRTASAIKKNKENIQWNDHDSSLSLITDEVTHGTPGSETKQNNTSSQKKSNKSAKRLFN